MLKKMGETAQVDPQRCVFDTKDSFLIFKEKKSQPGNPHFLGGGQCLTSLYLLTRSVVGELEVVPQYSHGVAGLCVTSTLLFVHSKEENYGNGREGNGHFVLRFTCHEYVYGHHWDCCLMH